MAAKKKPTKKSPPVVVQVVESIDSSPEEIPPPDYPLITTPDGGTEYLTTDDGQKLLRDVDGFNDLSVNQRAFLIAFTALANRTRAAKAVGISRFCHDKWLKSSPIYKEVFTEAKEIADDYLEAEAYRRAKDGLTVRKFHPKTGQDYYEKEYSDRLLEFLLKAHRPTVFRENKSLDFTGKVQNEVSGPNGQPIEVKNPSINWDLMPIHLKMQLLEFIEQTEVVQDEPKQIEAHQ